MRQTQGKECPARQGRDIGKDSRHRLACRGRDSLSKELEEHQGVNSMLVSVSQSCRLVIVVTYQPQHEQPIVQDSLQRAVAVFGQDVDAQTFAQRIGTAPMKRANKMRKAKARDFGATYLARKVVVCRQG